MGQKKDDTSREVGILIIGIIANLFILLQSINGFGRRDNGFGFMLLLASIFFSISFSYLFKKIIFFKSFLIFSYVLHSTVIALIVFSDSSPIINRIIVFCVLQTIISVLFWVFYKKKKKELSKG